MKETIVLGGGCFWCLDAAYRLVKGVVSVTSGYSGGHTQNPTYYQVGSGRTGHAEVVKIDFDPQIIGLASILDIFWAMHNPTTLNYQGNDHGTQYRSIILFTDPKQKMVIKQSLKAVARLWTDPIVTEVRQLEEFYLAEPEHQDYFNAHPEQAYCQVVINPKLAKLKEKFTQHLQSLKN